jgi:hypothetical protein
MRPAPPPVTAAVGVSLSPPHVTQGGYLTTHVQSAATETTRPSRWSKAPEKSSSAETLESRVAELESKLAAAKERIETLMRNLLVAHRQTDKISGYIARPPERPLFCPDLLKFQMQNPKCRVVVHVSSMVPDHCPEYVLGLCRVAANVALTDFEIHAIQRQVEANASWNSFVSGHEKLADEAKAIDSISDWEFTATRLASDSESLSDKEAVAQVRRAFRVPHTARLTLMESSEPVYSKTPSSWPYILPNVTEAYKDAVLVLLHNPISDPSCQAASEFTKMVVAGNLLANTQQYICRKNRKAGRVEASLFRYNRTS